MIRYIDKEIKLSTNSTDKWSSNTQNISEKFLILIKVYTTKVVIKKIETHKLKIILKKQHIIKANLMFTTNVYQNASLNNC